MLLDHTGIAVAQVRGHHHGHRAIHDRQRRVGVSQYMKADRRGDLGPRDRFAERPRLVTTEPALAIRFSEYRQIARLARGEAPEQGRAFVIQNNVPRLSGLRQAYL